MKKLYYFSVIVFSLIIVFVACQKEQLHTNRLPTIPTPIANFTTSGNNCLAPCTVEFKSTSTNLTSNAIFEWDLGDGTIQSGIEINHEYSTAGIFIVKLTVKNSENKSNTITREVVIKGIQANFSVSDTICKAPCSIDFDASSTENVSTLEVFWDFQSDGTLDDSGINTNFIYDVPGEYLVTLKIRNGTNSSTSTKKIVVTPPSFTTSFDINTQGVELEIRKVLENEDGEYIVFGNITEGYKNINDKLITTSILGFWIKFDFKGEKIHGPVFLVEDLSLASSISFLINDLDSLSNGGYILAGYSESAGGKTPRLVYFKNGISDFEKYAEVHGQGEFTTVATSNNTILVGGYDSNDYFDTDKTGYIYSIKSGRDYLKKDFGRNIDKIICVGEELFAVLGDNGKEIMIINEDLEIINRFEVSVANFPFTSGCNKNIAHGGLELFKENRLIVTANKIKAPTTEIELKVVSNEGVELGKYTDFGFEFPKALPYTEDQIVFFANTNNGIKTILFNEDLTAQSLISNPLVFGTRPTIGDIIGTKDGGYFICGVLEGNCSTIFLSKLDENFN
ncbi:MAG: PKD domain-containing protein [Bacteroidota bacterium]